MASNDQALKDLLDVYDQALSEGDQKTADEALALYHSQAGDQQQAPPAAAAAPAKPGIAATANHNPYAVFLDALATMGTGAVAYPAGGIAGLVAAPFVGPDRAESIREGTQSLLSWEPKTENAQKIIGAVSKPFEALHAGAQAAGDKSLDSGFQLPGYTPEETAATVSTTLEGVPQAVLSMLGGGEAASLKGIKRAAPTAEGRALQAAGLDLKRSQMGSEVAKSMDRGSDAVLGESSFDVKQAADYNKAVMDRAGGKTNADGRVTPAELKDLGDDISNDYNALHQRRSTPLDTKLDTDLQQAIADAAADGLDASDPGARRVIAQVQQFRDLANKNGGHVPGVAGQRIRTKLGNLAQGDDGFVANFALAVQEALDNAWTRAAPMADRAKMARTRERFRMKLAINKAMKGNATGYLSPNKLYSVLEPGHPLSDLAYAGKNVLPDSVANSGTPTRGADIGKIVSMANPNKWGDLARTVGAAFGGRFLNESPNLGMKSAAVAGGMKGVAAASSGESMLAEQDRRTQEYLRAIGAL